MAPYRRRARTPLSVLDAAPHGLALEPGMSDDEIDRLGLPGSMPPPIRELLRRTRGIGGHTFQIGFGLEAVFPAAVTVGDDGAGNFWVVDVLTTGAWDRVYFACHDPPEITLCALDLAEHLASAIAGEAEVPHREVAPVTPHDEVTRALAARVGAGLDIVDLRNAEIGDGFTWGRAGPETEIVRAGDAAVWAIARRRSLLERWLGRR